MKGAFLFVVVGVVLGALQTTVASVAIDGASNIGPLFFLRGHTVNLIWILTMYLGLNRDLPGAMLWGVAIGTLSGWFGPAWQGPTLATSLFIAVSTSAVRRHVLLESGGAVVLFVISASLVAGGFHLWMGKWLSRIPGVFEGQFFPLVVQSVVDGLAAPIFFVVFRWLDGTFSTSRRMSRSPLTLEV